jgi:hypothetical protein
MYKNMSLCQFEVMAHIPEKFKLNLQIKNKLYLTENFRKQNDCFQKKYYFKFKAVAVVFY